MEVESAQDSDFTNCLLLPLNVHEFHSVVLFDCHLLPTRLVDALLHHRVSTVTNCFTKMVVVEVGAVWCRELIKCLRALIRKSGLRGLLFIGRPLPSVSQRSSIEEVIACVLLLLLLIAEGLSVLL